MTTLQTHIIKGDWNSEKYIDGPRLFETEVWFTSSAISLMFHTCSGFTPMTPKQSRN